MTRAQTLVLALVGAVAIGAAGFLGGRITQPDGAPTPQASTERKPLYWYDPMYPAQHFDKPGKSPFMDMQLQPKYADEVSPGAAPGVRVAPAQTQSLGVRLAKVERGALPGGVSATGVLAFNERRRGDELVPLEGTLSAGRERHTIDLDLDLAGV